MLSLLLLPLIAATSIATTSFTTSPTLLSLALSNLLFLNFLISYLLKSVPIVKILTEISQQRQFFCLRGNIHLDIRLPLGFRWQLCLSLEENFSFLTVEMGIALVDTSMTRIWTNKFSEAKFGALVLSHLPTILQQTCFSFYLLTMVLQSSHALMSDILNFCEFFAFVLYISCHRNCHSN